MLPGYIIACIRFGISPKDWYDFEACLERRYEQEIALRGHDAAKVWLRREALACIGQRIKLIITMIMSIIFMRFR